MYAPNAERLALSCSAESRFFTMTERTAIRFSSIKKSPCPKCKGRQRASPARETLLSSPLRSDRSFRSGRHIISQASAARQQIGRAAPCNFGILFQLFLTYAFPPKSRIILTAASEKSSASTSSVLLSTPRASTLTDVAF